VVGLAPGPGYADGGVIVAVDVGVVVADAKPIWGCSDVDSGLAANVGTEVVTSGVWIEGCGYAMPVSGVVV